MQPIKCSTGIADALSGVLEIPKEPEAVRSSVNRAFTVARRTVNGLFQGWSKITQNFIPSSAGQAQHHFGIDLVLRHVFSKVESLERWVNSASGGVSKEVPHVR